MSFVANVVDIPRTDAFVYVGKTIACRVLFTQQLGHEGVHTRRREKDSGVVFRNQGCGRDNLMSAVFEKAQIHFA